MAIKASGVRLCRLLASIVVLRAASPRFAGAVGPDQAPTAPNRLDGRIDSVAFAPDGRSIVSGGSDAILRLWDAASGDLIKTFGPIAEMH